MRVVMDGRRRRVMTLVAKLALDAGESLGRVGKRLALLAVLAGVVVALRAGRARVRGGRGRAGGLALASARGRKRRRQDSDKN